MRRSSLGSNRVASVCAGPAVGRALAAGLLVAVALGAAAAPAMAQAAGGGASASAGEEAPRGMGRRSPRVFSGIEPTFQLDAKSTAEAIRADGRTLLAGVGSWVYHIKSTNAEAVRACPADVAVIDHSADGSGERIFSKDDVARMKAKPGGRQMRLISYMSIGEAEDYRYYWQRAWSGAARPAWLGRENPNWRGNFNVRYWTPEWQRIIFGTPNAYLDRIIAAGFDGVYLDIVDGFEFWMDRDRSGELPRATAAEEMVAFVSALARYAWSQKPGFLVIPQNGEALLRHPAYRAHISAIATEDVFYRGVPVPKGETREDDVERQHDAETTRRLGHLALAQSEGIPILSVEYLMDQPEDTLRTQATAQMMRQRRLVPHFSVRQLDRLQCGLAN